MTDILKNKINFCETLNGKTFKFCEAFYCQETEYLVIRIRETSEHRAIDFKFFKTTILDHFISEETTNFDTFFNIIQNESIFFEIMKRKLLNLPAQSSHFKDKIEFEILPEYFDKKDFRKQ